MKNRFPILYITYDGLLDPLGSSQILPYIYGISRHSGPIFILSFEKKNRFLNSGNQLKLKLLTENITWYPLVFSRNIGFFGTIKKIWDLLRMYVYASYISINHQIKIVHARSHVASWVALFLKRTLNVKFIFDCRGLWVDERIDKGSWDLNKVIHRLQYKFLKNRERSLFKNADHIIVLTEAVINEVFQLGASKKDNITVIPCCADFNHFKLPSIEQKINARKLLGWHKDAFVMGYLGSIGKMYMIDTFLKLFKILVSERKDIFALIITPDVEEANDFVDLLMPISLKDRIKILSGTREEVPKLLAAINVLISFIKPSYARLACSPSKNAEALAMGIPLICNNGIGDVEKQINLLNAGYVVDLEKDYNFQNILQKFEQIKFLNSKEIRTNAYQLFDISLAYEKYKFIYNKLKK